MGRLRENIQDTCMYSVLHFVSRENMKVHPLVKNLALQVKESAMWNLPPVFLAVIGMSLLPIVSSILFMVIGLSLLFVAFLAFEGTMLTIGAGIVGGMLVSALGMILSMAVVIAVTVYSVSKMIDVSKSIINFISSLQLPTNSFSALPVPAKNQITIRE